MNIACLAGYTHPNSKWLDGDLKYNEQGPAVAFLIPDEVADLSDDAQEWQDIARLLK